MARVDYLQPFCRGRRSHRRAGSGVEIGRPEPPHGVNLPNAMKGCIHARASSGSMMLRSVVVFARQGAIVRNLQPAS
jgi:hypothetical protein